MASRRQLASQTWANRYAYNELAENADEVEWRAVLEGQAHVSVGTFDEAMADAGDALAPESAEELISKEPLQGVEILQEARQGSVLELLQERQKILGERYPFVITGNSLQYQTRQLGIYELLLGICQLSNLSTGESAKLPPLFEEISVIAGKSFLGQGADGFRVGWPRVSPEGTPSTSFRDVIAELKIKSGNHEAEWDWQPYSDLPDNPPSTLIKDGGLDVVLWKSWQDNRIGQLYLLGQCACGKDWLKKTKDLNLERLKEWFQLPRTLPVRSFFTPRHGMKEILKELSRDGGLIFDRIRLVNSVYEADEKEIGMVQDRISQSFEITKRSAENNLHAS